jgi:hypothetical protein
MHPKFPCFFFRLREELWGIYVVVPLVFLWERGIQDGLFFFFFGRGEE